MKTVDKRVNHLEMNDYETEFLNRLQRFESASTFEGQNKAFICMNEHRLVFETSYNYIRLQHFRDMKNESFQKEYIRFNEIESRYLKLTTNFYHSLLNAKFRSQLEERWGMQLFRLAELKQNTYSIQIEEDLQKENRLIMEYQSLLGNAVIHFNSKEMSLSAIVPYLSSPNRSTRTRAYEAKSQFFKANEKQLDEVLNVLVQTRTTISTKLGYSSFIELGYKRMNRTSHIPSDLRKYRNQVKTYGVPFVSQLRKSQKHRIGVEKLKYYDEQYLFPDGLPSPKGSNQDVRSHFKKMFSELSPETDTFYDEMASNNCIDTSARADKMGGNFATYIGEELSPYVFANFHGTANDIRVFTHEVGHAFQFYMSRHWNIPEYIIPYDSAEVFSFGMERLAWPWMDHFFGENTKQYQYSHLTTAFMYMPLASATDEFEHYLYEQPTATIEDRKLKWRELELKYLPERDYDGNEFMEKGTSFYEIGHIFTTPFYFMDYDLAHFCSVQLWQKHQENPKRAWTNYLDMCKSGGSLPFNELMDKAQLQSPFEENSLQPLLNYVQGWIEDSEERIQ